MAISPAIPLFLLFFLEEPIRARVKIHIVHSLERLFVKWDLDPSRDLVPVLEMRLDVPVLSFPC